MKKILLFLCILLFFGTESFSQNSVYPISFNYSDFVSDSARDQLVQKPCYVHATIAGIETMYNLYYGFNEDFDLSERALFSCCKENGTYPQALAPIMNYVKQTGVIFERCKKYPELGSDSCNEGINNRLFNIIYDTSIDCYDIQEDCGTRFKIEAETISIVESNPEIVKKSLLSYGPIIFSNGNHAMLLIGWDSLNWIVRDSWPCGASSALKVPFNSPFRNSSGCPYIIFSEEYIIKSITKEKFNSATNIWSVETSPEVKFINLGFLKIGTINNTCFNRGDYEVKGLSDLFGATVTGWSYSASGNFNNNLSLSFSGNKCTVSGNAADVTLYATIKKYNGILEKVSLYIGTVGIPGKVVTINGHCQGTNYEVTSNIEASCIKGCSYQYKYTIPSASDGRYTYYTNGQYAYWTFKVPTVLKYSTTITGAQTNCASISNTQSVYIYASYCGTSYKSIDSTFVINKQNEDLEENSPLVSPNPAKHELTLEHVGKGVNDIKIYNLSGTLVYSVSTEKTVTIDVGMLPRGVYIVRYNGSEKQQKPIKIVLE